MLQGEPIWDRDLGSRYISVSCAPDPELQFGMTHAGDAEVKPETQEGDGA